MNSKPIVTSQFIYHELSRLNWFEVTYLPEFRNPKTLDEFYFPRDLFLSLPNGRVYIPSALKEKKEELSAFFKEYGTGLKDLIYGKALNPKVLTWVREYFAGKNLPVVEGKTSIEGGNIQFGTTLSGKKTAVIGSSSVWISCHQLFLDSPAKERYRKENLEETKQVISEEIGIDVQDLIVVPQREYHIDLEMIVSDGVVYYHDDHLALDLLDKLESSYGSREIFQQLKLSANKQNPIKAYCREVITEAGFRFKEVPGSYRISNNEKLPTLYINFMNGIFYGEGKEKRFLTNGCQPSDPLLETGLVRELQLAFDQSIEAEVVHLPWKWTQWLHQKKSGIRCATNFLP